MILQFNFFNSKDDGDLSGLDGLDSEEENEK